ncbi:unnamed protein product [Nezara viridula]|uniref:CRAL-TRIO domain-containing protein n=1 Tax=Nezara viridula TaxID=85310 RepID=A0A9P0H1F6_NEZVI|nr:unnamed protein product [Nezara viridula]
MVSKEVRTRSKEEVEGDIGRLQEWLLKQPHLPHVVQKDILSTFVVGTKSLEIAKQKLEANFTWRGRLPNIFSFSVRDGADPYFKRCSRAGQLFFLPKPSPLGFRVIFMACKFTDGLTKLFDQDQTLAAVFMSLELAMRLWSDMEGLYIIIDMETFSLSHVTMLNLNTIQACIRCYLESVPIKFKGAAIINAGHFINMLFNSTIKPFLSEKFLDRVSITTDDERTLQNQIPTELLPSDYGGNEKSSTELSEDWINLLEENRDWFKMTSFLIADESKRPSDSKHTFGVDGTFRKINID